MTFDEWWLSLPLDLRELYGGQAIGPAKAAWVAAMTYEREACAAIIEAQDIDPAFKLRLVTALQARS